MKHTCKPDLLANYFGANPGAPHYLTPVHFRRDVLAKYYDDPELYTVEDGYLRCAFLWGLQIDNDHDDRVVVFLGDLGQKLPSAERDHWRGYMISADAPISETNLRRSFFGLPSDPTAIDLAFRRVYNDATRAWVARYGWPLFREPKETDIFLLQQLRVPLNDTHNEFEEAIKLLGKLMSDALNESSIGKALPNRIDDEKGISKFERFLNLEGYPHVERDIKYLRRVQELRSKVSAHLKGRDYEKVLTKNLGDNRGAQAIQSLLGEGVTFLHDLIAWVGPTDDEKTADEPVVQPSRRPNPDRSQRAEGRTRPADREPQWPEHAPVPPRLVGRPRRPLRRTDADVGVNDRRRAPETERDRRWRASFTPYAAASHATDLPRSGQL